jgi:hypothetical protein
MSSRLLPKTDLARTNLGVFEQIVQHLLMNKRGSAEEMILELSHESRFRPFLIVQGVARMEATKASLDGTASSIEPSIPGIVLPRDA